MTTDETPMATADKEASHILELVSALGADTKTGECAHSHITDATEYSVGFIEGLHEAGKRIYGRTNSASFLKGLVIVGVNGQDWTHYGRSTDDYTDCEGNQVPFHEICAIGINQVRPWSAVVYEVHGTSKPETDGGQS